MFTNNLHIRYQFYSWNLPNLLNSEKSLVGKNIPCTFLFIFQFLFVITPLKHFALVFQCCSCTCWFNFLLFQRMGWQNFAQQHSAGHVVSVATSQLCYCSVKDILDSRQWLWLCFNKSLKFYNRESRSKRDYRNKLIKIPYSTNRKLKPTITYTSQF